MFRANLLNSSIYILAFKAKWRIFFIVISCTLDQIFNFYLNLITFETSLIDESFFTPFSILIFSFLINECYFFINFVALISDFHKHWFLDKTRSLNIGFPFYFCVFNCLISINFIVYIKAKLLFKRLRIFWKVRIILLSKSTRINALFYLSLGEFIIR